MTARFAQWNFLCIFVLFSYSYFFERSGPKSLRFFYLQFSVDALIFVYLFDIIENAGVSDEDLPVFFFAPTASENVSHCSRPK